MRDWLTTRDVRALLAVSQQRVSQLVASGELVAERDSEGRLRYDRITAEEYQRDRAARKAESSETAELRRARQTEARERFARERRRAEARVAAREREITDWRAGVLTALNNIADALTTRKR